MKKLLIGLILGGLLTLAVPAIATHTPSEPTNPITRAELRVFQYPAGLKDPAYAVDCSPGVVETYEQHHIGEIARIEGYVSADAFPSEHFIVRLDVNFRPRYPESSTANPDWNNEWGHQNIPPHPQFVNPGGLWKVINGNQYFSIRSRFSELPKPKGVWEIIMTITGQESGNVFTEVCRFDTRP